MSVEIIPDQANISPLPPSASNPKPKGILKKPSSGTTAPYVTGSPHASSTPAVASPGQEGQVAPQSVHAFSVCLPVDPQLTTVPR